MRYQGTSLPAVLRLLSAPHGSCMSGDHGRIHTEASPSADPHAHGHGKVCGCRWRRWENVSRTLRFTLTRHWQKLIAPVSDDSKTGYHARKMLRIPQRRRGLTCHTLGRCTRHEMRLCATGALPARSSRTMTWQNFERVEELAGSGREVCRGGIHPGDLLVGYGQENRGRTRTFATSDWLRMGLRRRTLK